MLLTLKTQKIKCPLHQPHMRLSNSFLLYRTNVWKKPQTQKKQSQMLMHPTTAVVTGSNMPSGPEAGLV